MKRTWKSALLFAVVAALALSLTGCKKDNSLIEKVTFKPTDDLRYVRIALTFSPNVQSDMVGSFQIKNYGILFVSPYTSTQRFEVGFDLDYASIINDQDYIHVEPTGTLPNGMPIGLAYPVVEVRGDKPIHEKFDLFGYVDILHGEWLGVAAMFSFINDKNFPANLSVSQVFFRDNEGIPRVMASVFGPKLNADGTLARNGGISLFANVRELLRDVGVERSFYPERRPHLTGSAASLYEGNPKQLKQLERNLIRAFNQN